MARRFCPPLLVLAWLLAAGQARADPARVLVLHGEDAPLRPGLVGALRVQLVGVGTAEEGDALAPGRLSERVAAASAQARTRGALLALWVEPDAPADGQRQVVLYLVGARQGTALFEVMRLPDGSDADVDRSLALKVREVFDRVRRDSRGPALAGAIAEPPAPQEPWRFGFSAEVAALWSPSLQVREPGLAGLELGLGASAARGELALELLGWVSLPAAAEMRSGEQRLELLQRSFLLAAAAYREGGRLRLGGRLALGARSVEATGTTAAGAEGSVQSRSFALRAGPIVGLELLPHMGLSLWGGVELDGDPRSYDVAGVQVARAGVARPFVTLSLTISTL